MRVLNDKSNEPSQSKNDGDDNHNALSTDVASCPWQKLFEEHGLEEFTGKVEEVTGAKNLDDLVILSGDESMIDEAARMMGMKMIPKLKFKALLAKYKGEVDDDTKDGEEVDNDHIRHKNDANENVDCTTTRNSSFSSSVSEVPVEATTTKKIRSPSVVPAAECVAVCVDRSYSMGAPFEEREGWGENSGMTLARRSRMDAVKQVFYAFRDRTETSLKSRPGEHHELGLLSFDDKVEVHLGLTPSLDAFEEIIDDVEQRGGTAIYSAVMTAVDKVLLPAYERAMVKDHDEDEESTLPDLRVLCLTDGESNQGVSPEVALKAANSVGAVVDAIIVGDNPDHDLRKIVAATGGKCYQIRTLSEGFQLMESEGVVSLKARREEEGDVDDFVSGAAAVVHRKVFSDLSSVKAQNITSVADEATKAKSLSFVKKNIAGGPVGANEKDEKVVSLKSKVMKSKLLPSTGGGVAMGCIKRIMKELRQVANDEASVRGVHIFPHEANLTDLRVLIEGPPSSPFADGVFLLRVRLPRDYPFRPPRVTFVTPVHHPNVSAGGGICLRLLTLDGWTPAATVPLVLANVRDLLAEPDTDNALRQEIAEEVLAYSQHGKDTADGRRYLDHARDATRREASVSVEEFKRRWNVTENDDEDDH